MNTNTTIYVVFELLSDWYNPNYRVVGVFDSEKEANKQLENGRWVEKHQLNQIEEY